jgi:hypothetical protein
MRKNSNMYVLLDIEKYRFNIYKNNKKEEIIIKMNKNDYLVDKLIEKKQDIKKRLNRDINISNCTKIINDKEDNKLYYKCIIYDKNNL